jgi:hypothetical protein
MKRKNIRAMLTAIREHRERGLTPSRWSLDLALREFGGLYSGNRCTLCGAVVNTRDAYLTAYHTAGEVDDLSAAIAASWVRAPGRACEGYLSWPWCALPEV